MFDTLKKVSNKMSATAKKTKKLWNELPENTKTGSKLIGAEVALLTASSILRNRRKTSSILYGAALGCYLSGLIKLSQGARDAIEFSVPMSISTLKVNTSTNTDDDNYPEIDHDQF